MASAFRREPLALNSRRTTCSFASQYISTINYHHEPSTLDSPRATQQNSPSQLWITSCQPQNAPYSVDQSITSPYQTMSFIMAACSTSVNMQNNTSSSHSTSMSPDAHSSVIAIAPRDTVSHNYEQIQDEMVADFFGESLQISYTSQDALLPPPSYDESLIAPPSYPGHPEEQPASVARFMFIYGFLFPPFWFIGIVILLTPLNVEADWEAGKTEQEREALLKGMRTAELLWAHRCVYALITLTITFVLLATIAYYYSHQ